MIITRDLLNTASANTASEIQLGSCVTIIGNNAFSGYTNISEIEFPDSLQVIGGSAFQSCSGLTSIDIPSGVTSIGGSAFSSCSGLKKITVSAATPPSLGSYAFNGSSCMIYVPFESYDSYITNWSPYKDRITYEGAPYKVRFGGLDEEMFVTCNSSTTINASDVNPKYFSGTTSTTFGECVTAIGTSGFSSGGVKSLGDIVFSDSITSIGSYAFSRVSATSLSLNEGLETIGNGAFYYFNCNQPLELPSTITSIGANAFGYSTIPSLTINSDGTLELGANNLISGSSISAVTTNNVKVVNGLKGSNLRSITIHNAESIAVNAFSCTTATDLIIDGSGETVINDSAFGVPDDTAYQYADGSKIVNCTLGNCVTHIGKLAFAKSKIVNLTIPASVRSIGDKAFYTNYNIASQPLANVTFEQGSQLTSLGSYVFQNSFNITNISLPNSITSMGSYVFDYCTGLTTANVPSNLTSIPDGTFRGCRSLSSVTVGNRITSIGGSAFSGCTSLNNFTIPSGVTTIGSYAFSNCYSLTTLIIPKSVVSIGSYAFGGCSGLTSIIVDKATPPTIGTNVFNGSSCWIYVPESSYDLYISAQNWSSYSDRIVAVGMNYKAMLIGSTNRVVPCNGNTTLALSEVGSNRAETINIGSCTSVIGDSAFTSSNSLQYISIPSGVTTIGDCAFYQRNGLTSVTIPDSVTSIGSYAFYSCRSLREITIGSGVTSIGAGAFDYCEKLESITFNGETPPQFNGYSPLPSPYYDYRIYVPCNSVSAYVESFAALSSYTSKLVNAIPPCDLPYKFVATYLDAPDKTVYCSSSTTLESSDFGYDSQKSKSGITSVIIGDCVTTIGNSAFQSCSSLTSIDIPNSVTSISGSAFYYCSSLTSIDIPSGVTSIGSSAFTSCSGLTSMNIPSGVTSIGSSAFQYCNSLTSITINATTPPTLGSNAFSYTRNCPIYVPCQSLGIYLSDGSWSSYKSRLQPIPPCDISYYKARILKNDGTTYDVNCDTSNSLDSNSITSKESVVAAEIGNCISAITGCFNGCYNMSSVTFNEDSNIISIGDYTFQNCSGLTSINIPSSVTTIGYYAFRGCSSLSNITIPSNVNNISSDAFSGCTNLKTITLEGTTPPTVNSNTFRGYNGSIYVPCESFNDYLADGNWTNYKNKLYPTQPCPSVGNKLAVTYLDATSFQIPCRSASETVASGDTISYSKPYSSMTSAEIGSCVTSIAGRAFSGYTSLSSVTFEQGSQVTSIGNYGFYRCSSLTSINIPSSVTSIGQYAFQNCSGLTSCTIGSGVTSIGGSAFSNCSGLTSCNIPSGVTTIGSYAFSNCSGLTSIDIPSGVTTIQTTTFQNCTSVSSLTFAEGSQLTTIGSYAFRNCRSLRGDIVLPNGVTSIGAYAFTNCIYMDSITIPSGVTVFNDSILYGCVSLNSITIMATTPPELGVSSLDNTGNCPIYVPAEAVDTYKADITWGIYASRIEAIPNS